jgi:hypothetical protein
MASPNGPQDPREPRPEQPAEGRPPSQRDEFFLAAQWRLVENAPQVIQQAAKELMSVAAILSGLYFAAIELSQWTPLLPAVWRWLLLVPYAFWLPAFCCAWRGFRPAQLRLPEGAPDETAKALRNLAASAARWLKAAQWLLLIGLALMVLMIVFTFLAAGEVGQ